ncbi:fibrosin-1-like protein isoform X1 [Lates japonicus]|uniref:Fibrosin-1-like protein isoform X1 n=1 Tax=Lates japonicus TaxID=270547 RepID=A0AAD3MET1_LATJO|nr:fibrosin-1-like protein isoform X1 [Lates japonicus]
MNGKLDLFSDPPAPGVFPGFPCPHDLATLFSSTGSATAPSPRPCPTPQRLPASLAIWQPPSDQSHSTPVSGSGSSIQALTLQDYQAEEG